MNKRYYSLYTEGREASVNIYGDITSWPWMESDVSSYNLSKEIEGLDVDTIHVYINSYGGEVFEGLAIYNSLKRHKAKIVTYADGCACSIAAIIFAAGDERVMYDTSLLMIHNAWTHARGNAEDLRKAADDLEIISETSMNALKAVANISDEELQAMLDGETWIKAEDALAKGFATRVDPITKTDKASASARDAFFARAFADKPNPNKAMTVDVRITDLPEFQQCLEKLKALEKQVGEEPAPEEPEEQNLNNFLDALMGRKD